MDWTCNMHGRKERCIPGFDMKACIKESIWKTYMCRLEDYVGCKEIKVGDLGQIDAAQDRDSGIHLTSKASFKKIDISRLVPQLVYCHCPENTASTVLFKDVILTSY